MQIEQEEDEVRNLRRCPSPLERRKQQAIADKRIQDVLYPPVISPPRSHLSTAKSSSNVQTSQESND